jgi:DNA-binding IclR family transcriptional regulator
MKKETVNIDALSEYIQCGEGKSVNILAYFIKEKDNNNLIQGTQREIAARANVSLSVVSRTMKALEAKGMLKKVRSGCYMLSPEIMRYGETIRGSIMFRLWGDT